MGLLRAGVGLAVLVAAGALATGSEGGRSAATAGSSSGGAKLSFSAIAYGSGAADHYCAITNTGGAVCWGGNRWGQVGDGTHANRYRPVQVVGLDHGVKQVTVSSNNACALTTAGAVKCWGRNASGQLGNGTTKDSYVPVDVGGLSGVRQVSAGDYHTCALLNSGRVDCWGGNRGSEDNVGSRPRPAIGLPAGIVSITAATYGNPIGEGWANGMQTCALVNGGTVTCWNKLGPPDKAYTPLASGVAAITSAAGYAAFWCALTTAGAENCGGGVVPNLEHGDKAIDDQCALTDSGGVKCFQHVGETAQDVPGLTSGVKAVAGQCALLDSGWIKCWGYARDGALGNGKTTGSTTPVDVLSPVPAGTRTTLPAKPTSPGRSISPGTRGKAHGSAGSCSQAVGVQVMASHHMLDPGMKPKPTGLVLCGAFLGPGVTAMAVAARSGTCLPFNGWAVFRYAGGSWQSVPGGTHYGYLLALSRSGNDLVEKAPVPAPGTPICLARGTRSRVWRWNGSALAAGPSKTSSTGSTLIHADSVVSQDDRIWCLIGNGVECYTKNGRYSAKVSTRGQAKLCSSGPYCGAQNWGIGVPRLAVGQTDQLGGFRCTANSPSAITCTSTVSGQGFRITATSVAAVP